MCSVIEQEAGEVQELDSNIEKLAGEIAALDASIDQKDYEGGVEQAKAIAERNLI